MIGALGEAAPGVFVRAGLAAWLMAPPRDMIAETDAARLHRAVRELLPQAEAEAALREAGRATADYLLGARIPKLAQMVLRALPSGVAARALTQAISAHAWTFAGSGQFRARVSGDAEFVIENNPFCAGLDSRGPLCVWHEAVFARLFSRLVARHTLVGESECCAAGGKCCRFHLRWGARAVFH